LSCGSFDPENQRIMRELEKESGERRTTWKILEKESAERGTTWKTFGRWGQLRAERLRSLVLEFPFIVGLNVSWIGLVQSI